MRELRIVGPQFSDPHLFVRWLSDRFGGSPEVRHLGPKDWALSLSLPQGFHVLAAVPACMDLPQVYERLLPGADAVLLMLNRIERLRGLNAADIALARVHCARHAVRPVVAANDPRGGDPRFPTVPAEALRAELDPSWTLLETTIGPFESALRWSCGAEAAWDQLLASAAAVA